MPQLSLHQQQGLTLIEVLIALFILAMAAATASQVISRGIDVRLIAEEKALAQLCAENLLNQQQLEATWPEVGSQTGKAEQGRFTCYWRLTTQGTPLPKMRQIEIEIFPTNKRNKALTQLVGFLGKPANE